jgi:hypothetical protein
MAAIAAIFRPRREFLVKLRKEGPSRESIYERLYRPLAAQAAIESGSNLLYPRTVLFGLLLLSCRDEA